MRILLLLAVLGCEIPDGETTPLKPAPVPAPQPTPTPPPLVLGPDGWCPQPVPPARKPVTTSFEVTQDLKSIKPMRKNGFDNHQVGFDPDGMYHSRSMSAGLNPTVKNGKLRFSTSPHTCRETNAGCFAGYWETPAAVVYEDPTPVPSCIRYAFQEAGNMVIGFDTELRSYPWNDGKPTDGKRRSVQPVDAIDMFDGKPVFQDASATLWTTNTANPPQLVEVGKLPKRVKTAADAGRVIFAYTDDGLYALDNKTFATLWHVDGEVSSVIGTDVGTLGPVTYHVLSIERDATPKARVVLRMLDATGKETKRVTVYSGQVSEAHLERSAVWVTSDRVENILNVNIAK